jgi:hypothetical protein
MVKTISGHCDNGCRQRCRIVGPRVATAKRESPHALSPACQRFSPRFTLIEMARIHRDAMAVPGAVGTALPRARNAPAAASPASR